MTTSQSGEVLRVAYLTSQYPATSHTFIRREVSALRALGVTVDTFSVRAPAAVELAAESDRQEAASTFTLLSRGLADYARAHFAELFSRPGRYARTFALALRHRPPGLKAALIAVAHFGEAMLLAHELRRRGITHLHNHFANSGATVGLLASRQAGIAWSFTIHGISEFDYPAGLLLSDKIVAARFVACVSYFGRAQAERLVEPTQWPKLSIVRCGLELDRLPLAIRNSRPGLQLVAVGRLSAEKGLAGLLDAIAAMQSQRLVRLVLVGDGPLRSSLEQQIARLGLSDRVEFRGRLPEAETLAEIAHSDGLVLTSFMEGLPIVLMEALALGKPVIASRVAGIPELVRDGETGLLFAPSDWSELTGLLDRLADDDSLRQHLGANGPEVIANSFDIRDSARRLLDLFHQAEPSGSTPAGHLS